MKINNNSNTPNFGSVYRFNMLDNNCQNADAAISLFSDISEKGIRDFQIDIKFPSEFEVKNLGIYQKAFMNVDDCYDGFIESVLKQKNVRFKKESREDLLKPYSIYNRIVLSSEQRKDGCILCALDTDKVEELFKAQEDFYISPNGEKGAVGNCYQGVIDYLKSGDDINATEIVLYEEKGQPKMGVIDGRHRFAVMRDLDMDKIRFAMSEESLKVALKHGLVV